MDNFNLKGIVLIEKLDINTMEVVETLPLQENDISVTTLMDYFVTNRSFIPKRTASATSNYWNIYWSQSPIKQSKFLTGIPMGQGIIGGSANVNVGSPFFTIKPTPLDKKLSNIYC